MKRTHDYLHRYEGYWDSEAECRIEVWEPEAWERSEQPVIIATELAENDNTSVTNRAEHIAAVVIGRHFPHLLDDTVQRFRWMERYEVSDRLGGETHPEYAEVTFSSCTPKTERIYGGRKLVRLGAANWRYIGGEELEALLGPEDEPEGGRVYVGVRHSKSPGDVEVYVMEDGRRRELTHYPYHSPDGFEFGYSGSGPSDLALAILADVLGEHPSREELDKGRPVCWKLHLDFKHDYVATSPREGLYITAHQVETWLEGKREERERWL